MDVLELGVPFSDPLADGLVNQLAAQRGLASGTTPPKLLETVAAIRKQSQIPIVFYIYYNLLHRYGVKKFIEDCAKAGVDGLLVLDLPPEESENYETLMADAGLCVIYLIAPDHPRRADRTDRQTRHGIYLLCVAHRRDRDAGKNLRYDCANDRENSDAHRSAHRRRFRDLKSGASQGSGETRRSHCRRKCRRESNRGTWEKCRSRFTRDGICEVTGRCGRKKMP